MNDANEPRQTKEPKNKCDNMTRDEPPSREIPGEAFVTTRTTEYPVTREPTVPRTATDEATSCEDTSETATESQDEIEPTRSPAGHNDLTDVENTSDVSDDEESELGLDELKQVGINEGIRRAQYAESGWRRIIQFLSGDESAATSRLRRVAANFVITNRILHRIITVHGSRCLAVVVPATMRAAVLHHAHDKPTAGHQGVTRTLARIRPFYFWRNMATDVRDYVGSCVTCGLMKNTTRKPMGELKPLPIPKKPFDLAGIDKFGAIQNSPNGYEYVIVLVDFCTRYVVAEAIRDATAKTVSQFIEKVALQYEPKAILSDRGSEFKGDFTSVLQRYEIKYMQSSPRHPKCNGMVERVNQSLSQLMRTIITERNHSDWAEALPYAVHAYNTSIHEITRYSPHFLLYGVEPRLGTALGEVTMAWEIRPEPDIIACRAEACQRTEKHRAVTKKRYDAHRSPVTLKPGDLVMVEIATQLRGLSKRLAPRRRGPFEVTEVYDNNTVRIKGEHAGTTRINVERCIRILPRPAELQYDDGLDDVLENVARGNAHDQSEDSVRGPDSGQEGADTSQHDPAQNDADPDAENDDDIVANMTPLRRSHRQRKPTQRLIETMPTHMIPQKEVELKPQTHKAKNAPAVQEMPSHEIAKKSATVPCDAVPSQA